MRGLRTDFETACTSSGFVLTVIGTVLALTAGCFTEFFVNKELVLTAGLSYGYHLNVLNHGLKSEAFTFALPILATLSCGGAYLEEKNSGYYKFALPRYGRRQYVFAKVVVNLISGGFAVWLGVMLTAILEWAYFAPMEQNAEMARITGEVAAIRYAYAEGAIWLKDGSVYGVDGAQAINSNMLIPCLQWAAIAALCGAMWAALSQLFALLTGNRYMAYTASFLISYLAIILFTRFFDSIYIFNPRQWFSPIRYWEGGNLGVMAILFECVLLFGILDGIIMNRKIAAE